MLLKHGAAVDKARDGPNMHPTITARPHILKGAPRPQSSMDKLMNRDFRTFICDFANAVGVAHRKVEAVPTS